MIKDTMLVTSITPDNIEPQRLAIESWLGLGFPVTSLNTELEIEALKPLFENVEFVAVPGEAPAGNAPAPIRMSDVIAFLHRAQSQICALIKPDIRLVAKPETVHHLLEQARNSMVLASRTDVRTPGDATGEINKSGFDVFFFDRSILGILPPSEFCLRQPWWDHWLPSCLIRPPRRFPLKFASFPFAIHAGDSTRWHDDDSYERYGMRFAKFLDPSTHDSLLTQPPDARRRSLDALTLNVAMAILFESQWISCLAER